LTTLSPSPLSLSFPPVRSLRERNLQCSQSQVQPFRPLFAFLTILTLLPTTQTEQLQKQFAGAAVADNNVCTHRPLFGINSHQGGTDLVATLAQAFWVQGIFMCRAGDTGRTRCPMPARQAQIIRLVQVANAAQRFPDFTFRSRIRSQTRSTPGSGQNFTRTRASLFTTVFHNL
jgi:hypothetical protein